MIGQTLGGRYHIVEFLGKGGFAETWLAEDSHLPNKPLQVVKKLKPYSNDPFVLQLARKLFDQEAEILYKLGSHNQIPQLFAHFEENQEFYLVQEYVKGHNLEQEIPNHNNQPAIANWSEADTTKLLQEILEVLSFVHQNSVIHRDIKPANLMRRDSDGKIVLIDFGAVKQISTQINISQKQITFTVPVGTPGYMPYEQENGHPKLSSDIYALGMLGLQALTGLEPYQLLKHPDTLEVIWQDKVSISPKLKTILDKMVRHHHSRRYHSAKEALNAFKFKENQNLKLKFLIFLIAFVIAITAIIALLKNLPQKSQPNPTQSPTQNWPW